MPAAASAQTATSDLMTGLASGVGKGIGSEITEQTLGWALSSLGLNSNPNQDIVNALNDIESTLQTMSNQLADISKILQEQSCSIAAQPLNDDLSTIDSLAGRGTTPQVGSYLNLVQRAAANDGTFDPNAMVSLFDTVLNGSPSLEDVLTHLNNGLIDQGNAQQVISACGALIPAPTDTWDDRAYFASLHQILSYYFDYQARAALLVVEAYHYQAIQAWLAAGNSASSIDPQDLPQICTDPNAATAVKVACQNATDTYNFVLNNIRAQYGQAGAPYSSGTPADPSTATFDWSDSDPVVQIDNATGIVWVKNYDDFAKAGGYSSACVNANSSAPCGPGVGQYDHATFEKYASTSPMIYGANGGYSTTWRPASASDWAALTVGWSGGSTSYGDHLSSVHGFSGVSTARVFYTGDAADSTHTEEEKVTNSSNVVTARYHFETTRIACFVAMPMTKNNFDSQPFCTSGISNLLHSTSDHANSSHPCYNAVDTNHDSLQNAGITQPFFDFLYNMQEYTCKSDGHPNGQTFYSGPPGWLLQFRSWGTTPNPDGSNTTFTDTGLVDIDPSLANHKQYHWPVFDSAAVTCTTEPATGLTRSHYSLNGHGTVPRLCGADFDKWFDTWIVPPPPTEPALVLTTPAPVVVVVPPSSSPPVPHFQVTEVVDYESLVGAVDGSGATIDITCDPPPRTAFQLGVTHVTCSATGATGRTQTETFEVDVRYPFEFLGPLSESQPLSAKAGSRIRVAFSLGGDRGPDVFSNARPLSQRVDCSTGDAIGTAEPVYLRKVGHRHKRMRFWRVGEYRERHRASGAPYDYEWTTRRSWAGQCRQLELDLVDGAHHTALVEFEPRSRHHRDRHDARHDDDRHESHSFDRDSDGHRWD